MLPSCVMSGLPFRVDDWAFADLHDAVARHEAHFARGTNQFDVRPLVHVVMHIIGDLAEQDTFFLQYAMSLTHEGREGVSKRVMVLFGGTHCETESGTKVFFLVLSLVRDVWRIVYDYVKGCIPKRHCCVISYEAGMVTRVNVYADNGTLAASPKPPSVNSGIENFVGPLAGVKVKQSLDQFGVFPKPN